MADLAAFLAFAGVGAAGAAARRAAQPSAAPTDDAEPASPLHRFYLSPAVSEAEASKLAQQFSDLLDRDVTNVAVEFAFYVQMADGGPLTDEDAGRISWVLGNQGDGSVLSREPHLPASGDLATEVVFEVGPRLSFASPFSTNAVSILRNCGVQAERVERFRRFRVTTAPVAEADAAAGGDETGNAPLGSAQVSALAAAVHDRMTEAALLHPPLLTLRSDAVPVAWSTVPVLVGGQAALARYNEEHGMGWDAADLEYYTDLFAKRLRRDPTTVELFDISQSNSEHSRHWFFGGKMVIDGQEQPKSLFDLVKAPLKRQQEVSAALGEGAADNSVIAFHDNSSAIRGFPVSTLLPLEPGGPSGLADHKRTRHLLLTAETHNFPSGVAPFPGAETGTGGRIRDTHATGRGSLCAAGVAGYCVGNLRIPGHDIPGEDAAAGYPDTLAKPLEIAISASNGASDYGNKFGEPVVSGFMRSFGTRTGGARREWIKPIMFSAGLGFIDAEHCEKGQPEPGMLMTKIGGPAYRIGMGGSAASSRTDGRADLDFDAVQRGDAEMGNKLNRVVRAMVEMGSQNPIVSIHDQGAGGNCNVLKEICYPLGGEIDIRALPSGDASMSVMELWGAEYQENDALLVRDTPAARAVFKRVCERERLPTAFVGRVTADERVVVQDPSDGTTPVDLSAEAVLGKVPAKTFTFDRVAPALAALELPEQVSLAEALTRVMRLPSVGSKRWLTTKVDRSVTGLVAQQQCVGPLHTPLADYSVVAASHFETVGLASSVGEQPLKGLVDPAAMARLTVAEAVSNLALARTTGRLADVKASGNWMWAAKLAGEGAALWDAAQAMSDMLCTLRLSIDGGKDSLSMAAPSPEGETVKAPGALVLTTYAPCPDIAGGATPDLKRRGGSTLIWIDLSGRAEGLSATPRPGGSALAQAYGQVGAVVPDVEDVEGLGRAFEAVQRLVAAGRVLAGHDVSDGGLIVAAVEMAIAGNAGLELQLAQAEVAAGVEGSDSEEEQDEAKAAGDAADEAPRQDEGEGEGEEEGKDEDEDEDEEEEAAAGPAVLLREGVDPVLALFAEEPGLLLEVDATEAEAVLAELAEAQVRAAAVGRSLADAEFVVRRGESELLRSPLHCLRADWEATATALERQQCAPACVDAEAALIATADRPDPAYKLEFSPVPTPVGLIQRRSVRKPAVAILREEGSNGDREMASAFYMAGFTPWDISMQDLLTGQIDLSRFRGLAMVGGFSYADVCGSAKGWAASIRFHPELRAQFDAFRSRDDTFSLGVCNGCQLMSLLGWVPGGSADAEQPRLLHNDSSRFESRFATVTVPEDASAIMLRPLAGSVLGVWVAHGEGRVNFPDDATRERVLADGLAPLRYADPTGQPTTAYPHNPNGSPDGIAALSSPCGRHLAMMPHPERCVQMWQWPWAPAAWRRGGEHELAASPWLRMFQAAREWCEQTV